MQSTGHSSIQVLSFRSTHGNVITYVIVTPYCPMTSARPPSAVAAWSWLSCILAPRGDALARVPKQIQRRCDGMRPVFHVRTVLLGEVCLQGGSDLVGSPLRRVHRVQALSPDTGLLRSYLRVRVHVHSTPRGNQPRQ